VFIFVKIISTTNPVDEINQLRMTGTTSGGGEELFKLKTLCLAHSQVKLPRPDEHAALLFNGLGARRWQISIYCDSLSFRKAILSIYPRLKTVNGYNLWFINKEKKFQVIPEKVNNPRRIKNFLSTFKAECLLIIPVSDIQLMEENLEKLEKRNEELSANSKYSIVKERVAQPELCLICSSTGGGCDGALETVDSVMDESTKIADKIFNFLGIQSPASSEHLYRGKKICRRCLIAATELSDMDTSSDDSDSRYSSRSMSGDDSSSGGVSKDNCQTQPLDFSTSSSSSYKISCESGTGLSVQPPPSTYVYPFSVDHHHHQIKKEPGTTLSLALCNPIYTRKPGNIYQPHSSPTYHDRSHSNNSGAKPSGGVAHQHRFKYQNHSSKSNRASLPYSRGVMDHVYAPEPDLTNPSRLLYSGNFSSHVSSGPGFGLMTTTTDQEEADKQWEQEASERRAALSAQLFLRHKSVNLGVPALYNNLLSRTVGGESLRTAHYTMSESSDLATDEQMSTEPTDLRRSLDGNMTADRQSPPVTDGLNSTGSGSPGASSGASSDCTEEEVASEKRKPMKKRKFSSNMNENQN